jgi:hypothetical protein
VREKAGAYMVKVPRHLMANGTGGAVAFLLVELESGALPDGPVEAGLGVDLLVDLHTVLLELGADDVEVVVEFREHLCQNEPGKKVVNNSSR